MKGFVFGLIVGLIICGITGRVINWIWEERCRQQGVKLAPLRGETICEGGGE